MGIFADLFSVGSEQPTRQNPDAVNLNRLISKLKEPTQQEPYLRQRYPDVYGALGGFVGTAPDQFEGSVLDPRTARVRAGAEYGFPVGIAAQVLPVAAPVANKMLQAVGSVPAGSRLAQRGMIRMSHGSPYQFEKFDASKIGSGEGAQAYGYGHYAAGGFDSQVAKTYTPRDMDYENVLLKMYKDAERKRDYGSLEVLESAMTHSTPAELRAQYGEPAEALIKKIEAIPVTKGHLYNIEAKWPDAAREAADPLGPQHYLSFDEPLGQQSKAVQDLAKAKGLAMDDLGGDLIAAMDAKRPAGAEEMRQAGIPGIRYLDAQSRGGQQATTHNYVTFPGNESMLNIVSRNGQPVRQAPAAPVFQQAPVSPAGFYSAAEQAALNLQRNKGSGQAFINDLMKAPDVKKEELQATGLLDAFANKPQATKQEVIDYLQANRVNVGETRLDASKTIEREQLKEASHQAMQRVDEMLPGLSQLDRANLTTFWAPSAQAGNEWDLAKIRALNLSNDQLAAVMDYGAAVNRQRDFITSTNGYMAQPKFGQYTLPGGENYREVLLTLPSKEAAPTKETFNIYNADGIMVSQGFWPPSASAQRLMANNPTYRLERGSIESSRPSDYISSHWDEPNVMAHIRMNDRIDSEGKKLSLIEEIQSDWHQAGREKGYKTQPTRSIKDIENETTQVNRERSRLLDEAAALPDSRMDEFNAMNDRIRELTIRARQLGDEFDAAHAPSTAVPDAPMKETWYQTALRKAVKDAIDQGSDRVGITTGARQAERYDLSKQISEVHYSGTNFVAYDKNGNQVIQRTGVAESDLPDLIGKEAAKKLLEQPKQGTLRSLAGQDLQVGGEGMKKYYDEIYPKYLDKFAKKYGASVKEGSIPTERSRDANGIPSMYPQQETIRYIDITPQMREAFGGKGKGVPLFSAAPAVPLSFSDLFSKQPAQQSQPTQQSQPSTITKFSDLFLSK